MHHQQLSLSFIEVFRCFITQHTSQYYEDICVASFRLYHVNLFTKHSASKAQPLHAFLCNPALHKHFIPRLTRKLWPHKFLRRGQQFCLAVHTQVHRKLFYSVVSCCSCQPASQTTRSGRCCCLPEVCGCRIANLLCERESFALNGSCRVVVVVALSGFRM